MEVPPVAVDKVYALGVGGEQEPLGFRVRGSGFRVQGSGFRV